MSRTLVVFVMGFLLLASSIPRAEAQQDTLQVVQGSVARVTSSKGWGSGAVLHRLGIVATAAHTVGADRTVLVTVPGYRSVLGEVAVVNKESDIAILTVPGLAEASVGLRPYESLMSEGDEIFAFGYVRDAANYHLSMTKGIISKVYSNYYQIDASLRPGFSGGPVTTRGGRLIGISSFGLRGSGNFNFVIPVGILLRVALPVLAQGSAPVTPQQPGPAAATPEPRPTPVATPAPIPALTPPPLTQRVLPDGAPFWPINPRAGIGPVGIGSLGSNVEARIGVPTETRQSQSWWIAFYAPYGLGVWYTSSSVVDTVSVSLGDLSGMRRSGSFEALRQWYVTPAGVRLGDSRSQIISLHGAPIRTTVNDNGVEFLHYDGVFFGLGSDGRVIHIYVSRS